MRHEASTRANVQQTRGTKGRHAHVDVHVNFVESSRARFARETQTTRNDVGRDVQAGSSRTRARYHTKTNETIRAIIRRRNETSCVPLGFRRRWKSTATVPPCDRDDPRSRSKPSHHVLLRMRIQVRRASAFQRDHRSGWRSRAWASAGAAQADHWDGVQCTVHPSPDHSTNLHRKDDSAAVHGGIGEERV